MRKGRKVTGPTSIFLTALVSAALDYMDSILAKQRFHSGTVTILGPRAVPFQVVVRVFEQYVEGVMGRNKKEGEYDKEQYSEVSTVWPMVSRVIVLYI